MFEEDFVIKFGKLFRLLIIVMAQVLTVALNCCPVGMMSMSSSHLVLDAEGLQTKRAANCLSTGEFETETNKCPVS